MWPLPKQKFSRREKSTDEKCSRWDCAIHDDLHAFVLGVFDVRIFDEHELPGFLKNLIFDFRCDSECFGDGAELYDGSVIGAVDFVEDAHAFKCLTFSFDIQESSVYVRGHMSTKRRTRTVDLGAELEGWIGSQDGSPSEIIRGALYAAMMRTPKYGEGMRGGAAVSKTAELGSTPSRRASGEGFVSPPDFPVYLSDVEAKRLKEILVHCVGDHRRCQKCGYAFVPISRAEIMAKEFLVEHFLAVKT